MRLEKFIEISKEAWFETINEIDVFIDKIKTSEEVK